VICFIVLLWAEKPFVRGNTTYEVVGGIYAAVI
jgi:hypothetical protein